MFLEKTKPRTGPNISRKPILAPISDPHTQPHPFSPHPSIITQNSCIDSTISFVLLAIIWKCSAGGNQHVLTQPVLIQTSSATSNPHLFNRQSLSVARVSYGKAWQGVLQHPVYPSIKYFSLIHLLLTFFLFYISTVVQSCSPFSVCVVFI